MKIQIIWNLTDSIKFNSKLFLGWQFTHREVRWCIFYLLNKGFYGIRKEYWGPDGWFEEYTDFDHQFTDLQEAKDYTKSQIIIPDKYNPDENRQYYYEFE